MEGDTYAARWKKQGEKYLVYLDSDHRVRGSDINFEIACEELCLSISERYGDGEAVLNLLREAPQPRGVSKYASPALVTLGWNNVAEGVKWQEGLFQGGYCEACHAGIGKRTDIPLMVDELPKGDIGSFYQVMFSPLLLSEGFLSLLSPSENENLGLQEVICTKSTSRTFYEVNGVPSIKQVGVNGGIYDSLASWQCESCGTRSFSCTHPDMPDNFEYTDFCSQSDLPRQPVKSFLIEDSMGRKTICMPLRRWQKISNSCNAKGVVASRIYVLPEEQVDRNPSVRIEANAN